MRTSTPSQTMLWVTLALLLLGAVAVVPGVTTPARAADAERGSSAADSIKVHGHWVIEVRNPDGSLAHRREFDNAFTGLTTLPNFLARTFTVGTWNVNAVVSNAAVCGGVLTCQITESRVTSLSGAGIFKTLTLSTPGGGAQFALRGTFTAAGDGTIVNVSTTVYACAGTVAPSSCTAGNITLFGLTSTTLLGPVSVVNGQQVLVSVTISFS